MNRQTWTLLLICSLFTSFCLTLPASELYPPPTNWSLGGVSSWSQPLIASGAALPAVASGAEGDLFILADVASWTTYRHDGSGWVQQVASGSGGGGGDVTQAEFDAHVASATDPHTATMTVTSTFTIGSGTADTAITRNGTDTIGLASYVVIIPNAATPTAVVATGTIWYDSNTNKARCYDGSAWNDLW